VRLWYRILAQADGQAADVYVYDVIGKSWWDDDTVTAKKFIDDLNALPASVVTLRVHVNSAGGDVFDAIAIANALRAQAMERKRAVDVLIDGLAASAATIVTSAGDRVIAAANAIVMIHNPQALVVGDARAMQKMAGALDTVREAIIASYRRHSSLSPEVLANLMDETTWMNAEEALAKGFATEIAEAVQVEACLRPEVVAKLQVPEPYRARVVALVATPPAPEPAPAAPPAPAPPPSASAADVLRECTAAGCLELAEELVGAQATLDQVRARLATAREIRGLCAAAKLPELAEGYLRAATPADIVKAQLTTITATLDARTEINGHLTPPDRPTASRARLDPVAIYAERNRHALAKGASA